jgi:hypothetical protein
MAEDTEISVPPLKAHETRNIEWAKTASTEQESRLPCQSGWVS